MASWFQFIGSKMFSQSGRHSYLLPLTFFALFVLSSAEVTAQSLDEIPDDAAPPPVRLISKEEKSALAAVTDIKNRTRLTLELMDARLKKAEQFNTGESFSEALNELGTFQALMDDALKFLNRNDDGRGKTLDNFRRFEIALRNFTPRIELIRRDIPERFEYHVRTLLREVRDTRSKAIEPMFANTVVSEN